MSVEHTIGTTVFGIEKCGCEPNCKRLRVFLINPKIDDDGTFYAVIEADILPSLINILQRVCDA